MCSMDYDLHSSTCWFILDKISSMLMGILVSITCMRYEMKNKDRIKYTIAHRKAFRKVEKELLGHNTIRSLFHDLDKVFLYMLFDYKKVHNWHRQYSRRHSKARTRADYIQMAIDWECARYTKPDKPLNARETLKKIYPEVTDEMLPVLEELGL